MINEVFFWEHITAPDNTIPGYNDNDYSMNDISVRNLAGGNAAGNGGTAPGRYIASGQGFAIKAVQGGSANAVFNNSMRVVDNNDQYRNSDTENRVWLEMTNDTYALKSNTLLAFLPQTTDGMDPGYDTKRIATTAAIFTTMKNGEQLGIQSRETFDSSMEIALGFATVVEEQEEYTIRLSDVQGTAIENTPVFLVDKLLQTYVNLKERAYTFTSSITNNTDRFLLVFEEKEVLGLEQVVALENAIQLFPNPSQGQVTMTYNGTEKLNALSVINVNGQVILQEDLNGFDQRQDFNLSKLSSGIYFVQINSQSGQVTKKLILK